MAQLTPEQLEFQLHKLPNYTLINCVSWKEQIQQIDENYPNSMPTQLIIHITVLSIPITFIDVMIFFYYKF